MENNNNSLQKEQKICLSCGFCCDGTLFDKASLRPGEKGTLPEKMEENYFQNELGEFFHLPCHYFSGKCTIYNQKKAHICSAFRCRLLGDSARETITVDEVTTIISNVKTYRKEITLLAHNALNIPENTPFRTIQNKLDELNSEEFKESKNHLVETLKAKCLIFDVLLTRHFKSEDDFDKMIVTPETSEVHA